MATRSQGRAVGGPQVQDWVLCKRPMLATRRAWVRVLSMTKEMKSQVLSLGELERASKRVQLVQPYLTETLLHIRGHSQDPSFGSLDSTVGDQG